jgi:electron transfer flavoprotein beta subunit
MHIAVCIKLVPDPEAAFSMFKVDEQAKQVVPAAGLPWVVSPFDEQALEAALRIREKLPDARISVMTQGSETARNALKHGLAMGADDGVLLVDAGFEGGDAYTTALVLSSALRKLGDIDLVLTGRQAADGDAGVVWAGIAEMLGIPAISFAQDVQIEDGTVRVGRVLDDGSEVVSGALPALVTVSNEIGAARKPNLRETMRAARKPVVMWPAADLGLSVDAIGAEGRRAVRERVFVPIKDNCCEMIEGASPDEQAARLALRLREAKVI